MKFYLTLLRHNGKRLPGSDVSQPPRLVTVRTTAIQGFRLAKATCCTGGGVVAELYEPAFTLVGEHDFTLHGFESRDDTSTVQAWRLRPHV